MASNKAAAAIFIAALAMFFAVEVALAHHFHHLPHDAIRNSHGHGGVFTGGHTEPPPCDDSVGHYRVNGFDFKMEKGHEACYIACFKNVFVSESSPFTAEERCHKKCSSGRFLFSASAIATAAHTISSSVIPKHGIFDTSTAAEKPAAVSSNSAAAEKHAVSSTDTTIEKPAVSSTDTAAAEAHAVSSANTAAEAPAVSFANTAAEAPAVSSANTAAEVPAVSSADTAAEAPAVWSAGTEETNFGNPYS